MADYIYLLESRLSPAQQRAIQSVREIAKSKALTVFLVGGAVRDLTSGSPVRDLDIAVQGNALKLKKDLEKVGAVVTGEMDLMQLLFVRFPGNVRVEIGSTLSVQYPKPGKPVVTPASILEDLRRRDFTANAMALSLNEGSYGLLMDPLNGVADIENRELRLVSNYGFIEDPVRMIRAARYSARLGWQMEEKTLARYETGKAEGYISAISAWQRGYETEEIVREEDPLRVMRKLEQEGWMNVLCAAWTTAKANVPELEKLREAQMQLQMRGIYADPSAAQFPLLTARMQPKDIDSLKKSFARPGFVEQIESLEAEGKKFAAEFGSKQAALPSAAWKMLTSATPEAVLWVAYSTKSAPLQAKLKSFYTEWPQARQRIPYAQMQEMRIVPGIAGFDELVEKVFFELMDNKLGTVEEMKAFLEPYSPPAPPPTVHLRRPRAAKKDAKAPKGRKKAEIVEEGSVEDDGAVASEPTDEVVEGDEPDLENGVDDTANHGAPTVAAKAKSAPGPKTPGSSKALAPAEAVPLKKQAAPVQVAAKAASVRTAVKKAAPVKAAPAKAAPAKVATGRAEVKVSKTQAAKPTSKKAVAAKKFAATKSSAKHSPKPVAAKEKPKVAAKPNVKGGSKPPAKGKPAAKAPATATIKNPAKPAKKKR